MRSIPGAFGKRVRCPCCENPWNQDDNSSAAAFVCTPCINDSKGYTGIDPANFDPTVSPVDNFFLWSNGGWKAKNPIPEIYPSWNTFIVLRDMNLERLKVIVDDLQNAVPGTMTMKGDQAKLAHFYNSFMDEESIEAEGVAPLLPILRLCQSNMMAAPERTIAALHAQYGVDVFFRLYSSPDKTNSVHSIGSLYQGGLGMPDRDYYLDADKAGKRIKYEEYVTRLLQALGGTFPQYASETQCVAAARSVLALETQLAELHLTRTAARDPQRTYNKMSVTELSRRCAMEQKMDWPQYLAYGLAKPFDWALYFESIGKPVSALGDINVATVDAIKALPALLQSPHLQHYLAFHVVNSFATNLGKAIGDAHFDFHDRCLAGTTEQKPRWKKALGKLESALGDELGQLYVAKHFSGEAKPRALHVVETVRDALRERLCEVEWMSDSTREDAMKKMEGFRVKIGYPDKWLDYGSMDIQPGKHFNNVIESRKYHFQLELSRMNAPTDKERWFMTPQTVNAYYHPSLNEIVFPAAILQPPFFDPAADLAVQYGSLGSVVGHEMTHGFDDQGRKYDAAGNLRDWWTEKDGQEYQRRVDVMIRQAGSFEVHGLKLNGQLTCGENVADLGGVKLALRALKKELAVAAAKGLPPPPLINGFSPEQRLFLAWSQNWRENVKKERAIQLVTLDPHGPNEMRCNGTLRNIQEFHDAFSVSESDPMFLPVKDRVDIW